MKLEDLKELGFINLGGALWRKGYRHFVIDMLPPLFPSSPAWHMEIRTGSEAPRIEGRVETRAEMEILLLVLERDPENSHYANRKEI